MLISNVAGAGAAAVAAAVLLPFWLSHDAGRFDLIFGMVGVSFGLAALTALGLREHVDHLELPHPTARQQLTEAWLVFRNDRRFRRVAAVAAIFGSSLTLFPHYQSLARDRLGVRLDQLILWVVVQNVGVAVFSLFLGPRADRFGNRTVLRTVLAGLFLLPLVSLVLSHAGDYGKQSYWIVFMLVGLSPVTIRVLNNYALELGPPEEHPRYLSTLSFCISLPIFASPLVGFAVDMVGYDAVFTLISSILFVGWLTTWIMDEPRCEVSNTFSGERRLNRSVSLFGILDEAPDERP
jgi:predicted MFS family arabinose efflux permease